MESTSENENTWYAVKGLFRWYFKETGDTSNFEERVVVFWASSFDEALDLAEKEAITYCTEDPTANFRIESLNAYMAYLIDEPIVSGVEVFSRLMDSDLTSEKFLRRYYPKSHEHKTRTREVKGSLLQISKN